MFRQGDFKGNGFVLSVGREFSFPRRLDEKFPRRNLKIEVIGVDEKIRLGEFEFRGGIV